MERSCAFFVVAMLVPSVGLGADFAGRYRAAVDDAEATLELRVEGASVVGELRLEDAELVVEGRLDGSKLAGTLSIGEGASPFSAELKGGELLLSFDGQVLVFRRDGAKPEAREAKGPKAAEGKAGPDDKPASKPEVTSADECGPAVARAGALFGVSKTGQETDAANCRKERWPPKWTHCAKSAESVDDLMRRCAKLAFGERLDFKAERALEAGQDQSGMQPAFFSRGGDVLTFRYSGQPCGLVSVKSGPVVGAFLICAGKVLAGPVTHASEFSSIGAIVSQAAMAEAAAIASGFDLAKSVRDAWPHGGGTYSVHDAKTGKPLYGTY
ncbi:MAG: hypothetical protein HY791_11025 [Deltaproteobacteria bacterium]|nr:hypothetical protein [Deltaproteobacteria bacterium]